MSEQEHAAERDSVAKAVRRTMQPAHAASLVKRGARCLSQRGPEALAREVSYRVNLMTKGDDWRFRADLPLRRELRAQRAEQFAAMPLVSVVVPLYNTPMRFLKDMVNSVRAQSYQNWELVLVDASDAQHADAGRWASRVRDKRVRYSRLAKNEGISGNTNVGLAEAEGEYIALLDHDDVLSPCALYEMVKAINETGADVLYSDEVVLDEKLRALHEYHFKPDYSPDTLRGCNYITHLLVFKSSLLAAAGGGERSEYDGAQDYDLVLRLCEKAQKVAHVPKVLYRWRSHAASTASDMAAAKPEAIANGAKAVAAHLARAGLAGEVSPVPGCPGAYRTAYAVKGNPLVSVLIPNMDHVRRPRPLPRVAVPPRRVGEHGGHRHREQLALSARRWSSTASSATSSRPAARAVQGAVQFLGHQQLRRAVRKGRVPAFAQQRHRGGDAGLCARAFELRAAAGRGRRGRKIVLPGRHRAARGRVHRHRRQRGPQPQGPPRATAPATCTAWPPRRT